MQKQSFISPFSICMTVPLNMLYIISASCSFRKTTSAYQIDILHPTIHPHFSSLGCRQTGKLIDRQTDRQTARKIDRQAGKQADRIETQI